MKTTLQTIRKYAKGPAAIDAGRQDGKPVFYFFGDQFEDEQFAHNILGLRYTGWFTNDEGETFVDGSGLARGIVVTLPASPGFPDGRFLAGYHWGDNDERVIWPDLYSSPEDAARDADHYAERFADQSREDSYRCNEARDLETKIDDGLTRLRECIALRHRTCMGYARDEIRDLCETIRQARETLRTDYANYI